jgi:hypothetical protein
MPIQLDLWAGNLVDLRCRFDGCRIKAPDGQISQYAVKPVRRKYSASLVGQIKTITSAVPFLMSNYAEK